MKFSIINLFKFIFQITYFFDFFHSFIFHIDLEKGNHFSKKLSLFEKFILIL